MKYEYHEIANVFPLLDDEALLELAADIEENGLLQAIVLYEGKILDGRNRYRACLESGVTPYFEEYTGHDPVGFVVSYNMRRRHLTESQRAMIAGRLAGMSHGGDRSKSPIGDLTQTQAAETMNVGKRSVERARKVLDSGDKTLISAVDSGEMSVSAAEKEVRERKTPKKTKSKGMDVIELFGGFASLFKRWLKAVQATTVTYDYENLDLLAREAHEAIDEYVNAIKKL